MIPTSLLLQTDMIFHEHSGVVTDHGEYVSIETPSNPNFFWGNYLVFGKAPEKSDVSRWRSLFKKRFQHNPAVRHETFSWEGELRGATDEFLRQGFLVEDHVVLSAGKVQKPINWNTEIQIRPHQTDNDWAKALESHVQMNALEFGADHYRTYRKNKDKVYREMISLGRGQWFGAYLGNHLAADLGLFWKNGLGRFQLINTYPEFRRRGICGSLLYEVSQYGLNEVGLETLVVAADENYFAKDIYQSVGFKITERSFGVELRPPVS